MSNNIKLMIPTMKCSHCVSTIENALNKLDDVKIMQFDLDAKTLSIDTQLPVNRLISAISSAGYDAEITD